MAESKRLVTLFVAMSVDGFIAEENDGLDFLKVVERPGEDYGYKDFVSGVDTVILGRKTYEIELGFGLPFWHHERKCYVVSRTLQGENEHATFYNGDLGDLIGRLKGEEGKGIYVDGGAELVGELLKRDLLDRLVLSVIPTLVGSGRPLFTRDRSLQDLRLLRSETYPSGLVQLWYERVR